MAKLRAVPPEKVEKRLKAFWFGPPGSWKTSAAIGFPSVYLIDTERGGENDQYREALKSGGGVYFHTIDLDEIIREVESLLTERHEYRTLVIDPITIPYADACDKSARARADEKKGLDGTEFGANKREPDRKMRRLCSLLLRLDMTVILTSHWKTKWEKDGTAFKDAGGTFDSWQKLDYLFDLVFETQRRGGEGWATVRKSRVQSFPIDSSFPLAYDAIAERYGRDLLERKAVPVELASPERVARLAHLVETVKLDPEIVQKWLDKLDAESFAEMPADAIEKCIAMVESKLETPTAATAA